MSPTFSRPPISSLFGSAMAMERRVSARSDSAVVLSLDAWQIVGIVLAVILLCALVGGSVWWERNRSRRAKEEALPTSESKGTAGTNSNGTDEPLDLELGVRSPQKIKLQDMFSRDTNREEVGVAANGDAPVLVRNSTWPRASRISTTTTSLNSLKSETE
ncbi:hypothetical protein C8R45DRAFT_960722 [Mycena sanguinolenta]|nr:hypothetical protein C8R45DRAFT_960722 [Mycena sanguinolenta]